jgi:hypothetical protein
MARNNSAKQQHETEAPPPEPGEGGVTLDEILAESVRVYESGPLGAMRRADLEAAHQVAADNPRVLSDFLLRLTEVCTLNATTAGACFYALPRGGKQITGPSVRFAELVAYAWRSIRVSSVIISVDDDAAVIQGVAHDLETNRIYEVATRRVVQKRRGSKTADEDMKQLAVASGTSIAIRNAILRLVPRALLEDALAKAKRASTGKGTIEEKRHNALDVFAELGADATRVLAAIGRHGVADITIDDLIYLAGLATSVREKAITLDDAMRTPEERTALARGRTTTTPMDLGQAKAEPQPQTHPTTTNGPGDDSQAP